LPIPKIQHQQLFFWDRYVAMQGGTIHPPDKSGGILYPSTPRYKKSKDKKRKKD